MRIKAKARTVIYYILPGPERTSAALRDEPAHGLKGDLGRNDVAALELPVADLVAGPLESGNDNTAAAVDREPPVARAVGDEDAREALTSRRRYEPRRERQHVRKEIPVGDSQRERVGGPVGVATYGDARRIDRVT